MVLPPANAMDKDGHLLRFSIVTAPINGTARISSGNVLMYVPDAGSSDFRDSLMYRADDCGSNLICDESTRLCRSLTADGTSRLLPRLNQPCAYADGKVSIAVGSPTGLPPPIDVEEIILPEDTHLYGKLQRGGLPAELKPSDLRYVLVTKPDHGTVTIFCNGTEPCNRFLHEANEGSSWTDSEQDVEDAGAETEIKDQGFFLYVPDDNYAGNDEFRWGLAQRLPGTRTRS